MKPKTSTERKKSPSPPSDWKNAPADMLPDFAKPVATAIAPTQMMSSHTEVPST